MRSIQMTGLAAMAAVAVTAVMGAGTASATTLEVGGTAKNEAITIETSLAPEISTTFQFTSGANFATCTDSELKVATESPYTALTVGGKVSTLSFSACSHAFEVISPGTLTIERIPGTTDGTVVLSGAEWEIGWPYLLRCGTGKGTDIGILRGVAKGHATLGINVVLNCSNVWVVMKGTHTITSPTGLGVVA